MSMSKQNLPGHHFVHHHVPLFGKAEDVIKIMHWGLLVIFGDSLDTRQYDSKLEPLPPHQNYASLLAKTREDYIALMKNHYNKSYVLSLHGMRIRVWEDFICPAALHFAKAVLHYHRITYKGNKAVARSPLTEDQLTALLSADLKRLGANCTKEFDAVIQSDLSDYTELLQDWTGLDAKEI